MDMLESKRIILPSQFSCLASELRLCDKKVVTTNGIFDFLHVGHIRHLEHSKSLGDVLIVAINDDATTARLKGHNRPVNSQQDRAEALVALRAVDFVVIFSDLTPIDILDIIRPEIHTKGGDYTAECMPEYDVVTRHGGRVEILPLYANYSNSRQFDRIRLLNDLGFQRPEWVSNSKA